MGVHVDELHVVDGGGAPSADERTATRSSRTVIRAFCRDGAIAIQYRSRTVR